MRSILALPALTALFACALVTISFATAQAAGPFTAAKVSVDVTAGDAVAAKKQALDEAKQRALRTVFKRLAPYSAYDRLPEIKSETIDGMLENFTIRSEQNSRTRYLAMLDFEFNPQSVRRALSGSNILFSDVQADPLIVLPVFIKDGNVDVTGRDAWRRAWLELDLEHAVTPVDLVRHGTDIDASAVSAMLAGEGDGFARLTEKHRNDRLVLAVAEAKAGDPGLTVRLYGIDTSGPFALSQTVRLYGGDVASAARRAAKLSLGILEGRWKVMQTVPDSGDGDGERHSVLLTVQFSSLGEWQQIRSRLSKLPGVQGFEIGSLSARSADVSFRYPGGAPSLAAKLPAHGMQLMDAGGALVLRAN